MDMILASDSPSEEIRNESQEPTTTVRYLGRWRTRCGGDSVAHFKR